MAENEDWWTAPAESENGQLIMVTGRRDVDSFRKNPKFNIRINIVWKYADSGMPDEATAKTLEEVTDLLADEFRRDPVAVLTGIYTGDGRRDWVFYTLSTHIFGRKLNEVLADLPLLPLEISAENDPEWAEYSEMKQLTEITPGD